MPHDDTRAMRVLFRDFNRRPVGGELLPGALWPSIRGAGGFVPAHFPSDSARRMASENATITSQNVRPGVSFHEVMTPPGATLCRKLLAISHCSRLPTA